MNASGGVALTRSKSLVTNGQLALVSARCGATVAAAREAEVVVAATEVVTAEETEMTMATVETRKGAVPNTMTSKLGAKPTITRIAGVCK